MSLDVDSEIRMRNITKKTVFIWRDCNIINVDGKRSNIFFLCVCLKNIVGRSLFRNCTRLWNKASEAVCYGKRGAWKMALHIFLLLCMFIKQLRVVFI